MGAQQPASICLVMTEFERAQLETQADAIRIEVEATPNARTGDVGGGDSDSDGGGEDSGVPRASEEATPQPAPSGGKRAWRWLLRAVGVAGVLALTLNVFGVSLMVEVEPAGPELRAPGSGPLAEAAIRPSSIQRPEAALLELRQRITATRLPDRETSPIHGNECRSRSSKSSFVTGWHHYSQAHGGLAAFRPLCSSSVTR